VLVVEDGVDEQAEDLRGVLSGRRRADDVLGEALQAELLAAFVA